MSFPLPYITNMTQGPGQAAHQRVQPAVLLPVLSSAEAAHSV